MSRNMRVNEPPSPALRIVEIISRLILGGLFIFSGLVKSIDPIGSAIKIGEYLAAFGMSLPESWHLYLSGGLCIFETVLGFAMLSGIFRRITVWVMWITMLGMTALTFYIMLANPVADCGCFGDALKISNTATFVKNVVFLILATFLFLNRYKLSTFLPVRTHALQLFIAVVLSGWFVVHSIRYLPPIDFRPYSVGTSIAEGRHNASGEEVAPDSYRYVYAKDGEERTFTIDELSGIDSTWTYVRHEVPEQEFVPSASVADFQIFNAKGENITDSILAPQSKFALVMTHNINEINLEHSIGDHLRMLNDLVRNAGGSVRIVVANSVDPRADQQLSKLSLLVPIDHMDTNTIQTVVRSNPGVVLINGGTIVRKSSPEGVHALLKDSHFTANPFSLPTQQEQTLRQLKAFAPLILGAICFVIAVIYYHTGSRGRQTRSYYR